MISKVTPDDYPELLPLLRAYCDFYDRQPSDDDLLGMTAELVADPSQGVQLLATDSDGVAVGFATLLWSWSTTAGGRIGIMHDLFVAPEARGNGIADALIQRCAELCTERGCLKLKWQTAPDNYRAQAVYRRSGAQNATWLEFALLT